MVDDGLEPAQALVVMGDDNLKVLRVPYDDRRGSGRLRGLDQEIEGTRSGKDLTRTR